MTDHVRRRLIMLLDGTWNEDEEDSPSTNIVYLRERLFWGLQTRLRLCLPADKKAYDALPDSIRGKGVNGFIFDGFEYVAYYDRGVGTGAYLDVLKGGLTGEGLDDNIREAYRFLSTWFRPGDEIFVFGFSRGAYTARSLCGYIQTSGLLREQFCTTETEKRAWDFYRTPPGQRASAEWLYFRTPPAARWWEAPVHDESYARVRVLGVFDTVGALGIPAEGFRRINRAKYEFHDPEANSIVDIRLHAVAIDEPRKAFAPTLWTKPKFKRISDSRSPTEQVWFPGAHADIGGGYVQWNKHNEFGLSHVPLAWMLQRVRHHVMNTRPLAVLPRNVQPPNKDCYLAAIPFYDMDLLYDKRKLAPVAGLVPAPKSQTIIRKDVQRHAARTQHVPWAVLSEVRPNVRPINQATMPDKTSTEQQGRVPYADPIGEAIHASALKRFNSADAAAVDRGRIAGMVHTAKGWFAATEQRYRPQNLVNIIPYIAATYLGGYIKLLKFSPPSDKGWKNCILKIFPWKHVHVVNWDGRILSPDIEADVLTVIGLLPAPDTIGLTTPPPEMEFFRDRRKPRREIKGP